MPKVLLEAGHLMCGCAAPFTGRFCSCTSVEQVTGLV
jgi:hypothetical protein